MVLQLLWPLLWGLLSKSDIDAAFKRVWLALQDVDLFATDLPGEEILKAAWDEASEADVDELLEEMSAFAPRLRECGRHEAWMLLLKVITLVYLVLPFGWSGSPGRYGLMGTLPELAVQPVAPAEPRINGGEPFDSRTHVDDATRAEISLGYRPYLSVRSYDECAEDVFGQGAIHPGKRKESGKPTTVST